MTCIKLGKIQEPADMGTGPGIREKENLRIICGHMDLEKKYCHLEKFNWLDARGTLRQKEQPIWLLFDYEVRDPLTNEAAITEISEDVFI